MYNYLKNVFLSLHVLVYDLLHSSQRIYNEDKNVGGLYKSYMCDINN